MKKFTLFIVIISTSLMLFGQKLQTRTDENGCTIRSLTNQYSFEMMQSKAPNEWTSIGPYGGDVFDMAVYPLDPSIVFAAAGIPYISYNGGETWEYLEALSNLAPSGIGTFEAAGNGVIYASGPYSYYKIFRSTDGGTTWQQKSVPVNGAGLDIAVDAADPNIVYMGLSSVSGGSANNVIVKSEDGGDSWTYFNMTSVLPVGWSVVDLEIDPDNSQVIFAIGNQGLSNAAVVATFDGGETWENRTGNLPASKPYNTLTISGQNIYIAGGQLFGGQIMGVYKTDNYGQTWQNISGNFPNQVSNAILIDPGDPDKMYVATEGDGVYYTEDGGLVWNYNTAGAGDNGSARCLIFEPGNTDVIFAGFLSLAVCKSTDAAQSWEFSNNGIATLQTDDVEVNPNDPMNILIGFEAENSGGCYLSSDGGSTWQLVESLPGTRFSQVTFGPDETMYAWSNGPTTVAAEGLYKSTDGGQTWQNTGPNIGSVFETQIFALVASESNPDLLFIGGNNFGANGWESMIYRTTDGGANWENVYMGPVNNSFKYLFIDPSSADQIIYTGYGSQTDHAGFMQSEDGGDTWSDINSGIPSTNKWGGAIVCDPSNPEVLYGGVGGYGNLAGTVYKSLDGGNLWNQTSLSLATYSKISDILISPVNNNVVYAATTQDGVYISFDGGDNWEAANDGLPAVNVTGFSNPFSIDDVWYLCASTFSNSTFKTEVSEPGTTNIESASAKADKLTLYPNPSNGEISVRLSNHAININSVLIYNSQGKLFKSFNFNNYQQPVIKFDVNLAPDIYFYKIICDDTIYSSKLIIVK